MRPLLRSLATFQMTAVVTMMVFALVVGGGSAALLAFELGWIVVVLLTLESVGGILWCLSSSDGRRPAALNRRQPMRFWLRVLAQVEMGAGLVLFVATAGYSSYHFWARPVVRGHPLEALALLYATLGLMGIGGVLWCAVRVAYPDRTVEQM